MAWNVTPSKQEIGLMMEAGLIYRDSRRFQQAREVFNGVKALLPRSEVCEVALGTVSFQERDFDTAERHYRRALEMNPRSAYALAHLGELAIFRNDKDAAREHLGKAIELDPRGESGAMARSLLELADVVKFG